MSPSTRSTSTAPPLEAPQQPPDTKLLRCSTTADFLAALPQLTGFTASDSLFLVLFVGNRAHQVVRVNLPPDDSPHASMALLDFLCEITREHALACGKLSAPAVVISCSQRFSEAPGTPWRRLAGRIERRLRRDGLAVRELCCLAPDGWSSYLAPAHLAGPLPLSDIAASPVAHTAKGNPAVPDLAELGALPRVTPKRAAAVARAIHTLLPYETPDRVPNAALVPAAQHAAFTPSAPAAAWSVPKLGGWVGETMYLLRVMLGKCDREPLPPGTRATPWTARMSARLVRTTQHPDRWILLAVGLATSPHFAVQLVEEHGEALFSQVPLTLDDTNPTAMSLPTVLRGLYPDAAAAKRLIQLRKLLLRVLAETPQEECARLFALSSWVWWASGGQSVALDHAHEAKYHAPDDALVAAVLARVSSALPLKQALGATT